MGKALSDWVGEYTNTYVAVEVAMDPCIDESRPERFIFARVTASNAKRTSSCDDTHEMGIIAFNRPMEMRSVDMRALVPHAPT